YACVTTAWCTRARVRAFGRAWRAYSAATSRGAPGRAGPVTWRVRLGFNAYTRPGEARNPGHCTRVRTWLCTRAAHAAQSVHGPRSRGAYERRLRAPPRNSYGSISRASAGN